MSKSENQGVFFLLFFAANERIVFDLTVNGKRPRYFADGLTIDTKGNLYVATFNGSKVMEINPT